MSAKNETTTLVEKIGIVTIRSGVSPQKSKGFWILEYRCPAAYPGDPNRGRRIRRRIDHDMMPLAEVRKTAEHLTVQAYQGKGYLPERDEKGKGTSIQDGIIEALRLTNTLPEVRRERARLALRFVEWLAVNYPQVQTWDQMRPAVLQDYVLHLESNKLAFDTVRLAIAPIKLAWRHMADNFPDTVRPLPRIRQKPAPKREIDCLDADDVAALLEWLKKHAPDIWPLAMLQTLAGLRMLETAALRRQDVNLKQGTIRITDTPNHSVKTATSDRLIPICKEVRSCLKSELANQKVFPKTGEIFTNTKGNPWTNNALGWKWNRLRSKLDKKSGKPMIVFQTGRAALADFQPHRLRASFATMAGRLGVADRLLQAYMGHAPVDVLGAHYRKIGLEDLKAVSQKMDKWGNLKAVGQKRAKKARPASR